MTERTEVSPLPSALLASLFRPGAAAYELREPGDPACLYPEEAVHVERAVAKRAREFAAGRLCARSAMAALGIAPAPLPAGTDRRPQWPAHVVGSITHTHGFCAAVVGHERDFRALGVDAESISRVTRNIWSHICTDAEAGWLAALAEPRQSIAAALVFSGKEAFYKCQYTLTRQFLGFHEVMLEMESIDFEQGHFSVLLSPGVQLPAAPGLLWRGRFCVEGDLLVSAMEIPA